MLFLEALYVITYSIRYYEEGGFVKSTGPLLFALLILFFNIRVYYTSYNEQEVIVDEKDI